MSNQHNSCDNSVKIFQSESFTKHEIGFVTYLCQFVEYCFWSIKNSRGEKNWFI